MKVIDRNDTETMQCNQCQEGFETDTDLDSNDNPAEFVTIPVECEKGNFCSDACRARAMYEAQDDAGKLALRRFYLGAQLLSDHKLPVERIMKEWDIDFDSDIDDAIVCALSPDGGVRGVPGPEDDCEAYLMDVTARKIIWDGLYMGQRAAIGVVVRYEMAVADRPGDAYWQEELDKAKVRLLNAETALKTLEVIGKVA